MLQSGISEIACFFDHVYPCVDGRPFMIFLLPVLLIKWLMEIFSILEIKRKISKLYQGKTNKLFMEENKKPTKNIYNKPHVESRHFTVNCSLTNPPFQTHFLPLSYASLVTHNFTCFQISIFSDVPSSQICFCLPRMPFSFFDA